MPRNSATRRLPMLVWRHAVDDILSKILAVKCREVADLAGRLADFKAACRDAPPTRRLAVARRRAPDQPMCVVAEVKRRSPSARTASATGDVMSSISTRDRVLTVNVCTIHLQSWQGEPSVGGPQ